MIDSTIYAAEAQQQRAAGTHSLPRALAPLHNAPDTLLGAGADALEDVARLETVDDLGGGDATRLRSSPSRLDDDGRQLRARSVTLRSAKE